MAIDKLLTSPDLDDVLGALKSDIFSTLNAVQVGRIDSFDPDNQTASIQLFINRVVNGQSIKYPLLLDCPVFFIGNQDSYITTPVNKGDECIVLFNDRNIDNWFASGNITDPQDTRKHDLSDGMALVGIRSLRRSIQSFDNDNMILQHDETTVTIGADYRVENSGALIGIVGGLLSLNTSGESLYAILNDLITVLIASNLNPATKAALAVIQARLPALLNP